jgi:CSLREA domain-containing protein
MPTTLSQNVALLPAALIVGACVLLAPLLAEHSLPRAEAASIAVTTTADEINADGDCSLREAIQAANTDAAFDACPAGSGTDLITIPAGTYALAIAGRNEQSNATGDLDITSSVTINGAGAATTIIQGGVVQGVDRVFDVRFGGSAQISGLTVRGGELPTAPFGGVEVFGGGIQTAGPTTLTDVVVTGNVAGIGGGIFSYNDLTLRRTVVSGNTAGGPDGGGAGGIHNFGIAALVESTVRDNVLAGPAGITTAAGIYNGGAMTLTSSTVSGNSGGSGGGVVNGDELTISNSTTSNNAAAGIISQGSVSTETTISSTTVADGMSTELLGGSVTILSKNSIVSGCSGTITSQGYNLIESTGGCVIAGDLTGNLTNVSALLQPLAANGGSTQTRALGPGSPAIDAGSADCPPPASDQRGVLRPQGGRCDIGSYERTAGMAVGGKAAPPEPATGRPSRGDRWDLGPPIAGAAVLLAVFTAASLARRRRSG